jgi:hypothetical protein
MQPFEYVGEENAVEIALAIAGVREHRVSTLQSSLLHPSHIKAAAAAGKDLVVDMDVYGGDGGSLHPKGLGLSRWRRGIKAKAVWRLNTIWKSLEIMLTQR